jgi:hypothetical protein
MGTIHAAHLFARNLESSMEFRIRLATATPDVAAINDVLQSVDATAYVDIDPVDHSLRVTAWLEGEDITSLLTNSGHCVREIRQLPSICCGGCGG